MMHSLIPAASLAITLAAGASGQVPANAPDVASHFPSVEGSNLEGRAFVLPRDFEGALNIVVIAFTREQQADVYGWMPTLRAIAAKRADVRVYELPVLARRYRLIRRVIDGGMRGGIPDSAVRAATITLYIDKSAFKRALRIESEDQIQLVLVDRHGRIHGRAVGVFTQAALAPLVNSVESVP